MPAAKITLYYVYDPMCSWCWGYKPTWEKIQNALPESIEVTYVLGGLAPDSSDPMPQEMQNQIAAYWKKIERYLGTSFNYDFWQHNIPRRSTYPSCRAILAARIQGREISMLKAIQHAYYLNAKNPSNNDVLIECAQQIGLDLSQFAADLVSEKTHQDLLNEVAFARSIGGTHFPSLFLEKEGRLTELPVDYVNADATVTLIKTGLY